MAESDMPFDRWHKKYPKPGDKPCPCGTKKNPLYPSADHGRGQQWQARYTDPDGRPRRPAFDVWQEARDHLEEVRVAMRKGTWTDPDLGNERVVFYARQYIERRRKNGLHERTTATYESALKNHVLPFLGHRVAKTLKRRDTMSFIDHLLGLGVAPQTVHNVFHAWSIVVHYMIDEDVPLPANIVSRIGLPVVHDRVAVALTPEDVGRLAKEMREIEPRYEVLIWIAACAGLRKGEALGLTRTAVDWDNDLIYVREQRQKGKATTLKTRASKATLTVDHFLIDKLAEHVQRFPQWDPVARETARSRRRRGWTPPPDEGLVVTSRRGKPVRETHLSQKWRQAVKSAGLPPTTRFHDLKHFYTTYLGASNDHDPKTVQALSRHSQFAMTWDTYAHPPRAVDASVRIQVFTRAFGPTGDQTGPAAGSRAQEA